MQLLLPALAPVVLLLVWYVVIQGMAKYGPWARLAARYETTWEPDRKHWFQSGRIGGLQFRSALMVAATPRGLYLRGHFLFFKMPRPLLIPWDELEGNWERLLWMRVLALRAGQEPDVRIALYGYVVRRLQPTLDQHWKVPEQLT